MTPLRKKAKELVDLRRRATELANSDEPAAVAEREEVILKIKQIEADYGFPYFVRLVKAMAK